MERYNNSCTLGYMNERLLYSLCEFKVQCSGDKVVTRPHGNHQDVGSNPAAARNEKTDIGQTPAKKVPQ